MMRRLIFAALLGALFAAPAHANDTSAALGAGGLKFKKTNAIEMVSEDLFVSMDEVRVKYLFRNKTAKDVTLHVAFPLPDMKAADQESPLNIPNGMSPNFVNFKTKVDGKDAPLQSELKALRGGRDVTAQLIAHGAPLNPLDPTFSNKIVKLPAANRDALVKAKLVYVDQIDDGGGWRPYYRPNWDLKTSFFRLQTFPAGKSVSVEHSYQPIVGGTVMSMASSEFWPRYAKQYRKDYCVDGAFEAAARKLPAETTQERWITYILTTGANWAGPIGSFRLVVDKGAPRNLVSFCGKNVTKIAPTQFEMKAKNFKPAKDLKILVVTPNP